HLYSTSNVAFQSSAAPTQTQSRSSKDSLFIITPTKFCFIHKLKKEHLLKNQKPILLAVSRFLSGSVHPAKRSSRKMAATGGATLLLLFFSLTCFLHFAIVHANFFEPFNVSYDHRAMIIGGKRRMLISAGIHYPRATPQMWPDLIAKSKEGGADVIQTYVFWGGHEPVKGQEAARSDSAAPAAARLLSTAAPAPRAVARPAPPAWPSPSAASALPAPALPAPASPAPAPSAPHPAAAAATASIAQGAPQPCLSLHSVAGWASPGTLRFRARIEDRLAITLVDSGAGFPVWLRDIPGIAFRTDNAPFKEEMQRFVTMIVDLMRKEMLFSWQGGPIIMLQIENEYGNIENSFGPGGKRYMQWAANMALGLGAGVPWVMCKQTDAPENIIDACNDYYCDGFKPNSPNKPVLWTENWDGWYTEWGEGLPHRPVEDLAFAVARFFQRGGSFQNYYMYFGGTNFGRTSGGPFYITSYDYDAPLDEYGLLREPKWGHLKELHAAIKLCEPALTATDSPKYINWGSWAQEAHVYENQSWCAAFLANIDEHKTVTVSFRGQSYVLPPWSVSVLPDCKNVVFNTAKVTAQTSIKSVELALPMAPGISSPRQSVAEEGSLMSGSWLVVKEPITIWSENNFTTKGILEHLNVTKDQSDYLWYFTRLYVSDDDVAFWAENQVTPAITIDSMRDVLRIFINGQLTGSTTGKWVKVSQPVKLQKGYNDVVLLSQTMGLQNYGAFLERDGAGFRGKTKITGFKDGDIDLSSLFWTHQVGLKGEFSKLYSKESNEESEWSNLTPDVIPSTFTWYKTYFDAPAGTDPVALDLGSMGKGQAWVNGHHIGRYWTIVSPKNGCQSCNYAGAYRPEKCRTNCGNPTQTWYHVPRSWLRESNSNSLVLFEETGGNPFGVSVNVRSSRTVCGSVSESDYPPVAKWSRPSSVDGQISITDGAPEVHIQCQEGYTISYIEFASYGTPKGSCQSFSRGSCHAASSALLVSEACLGKNKCHIEVSNSMFGDPCPRVTKTLAVEARCESSSSSSASSSVAEF
ncbi:unnamed protein product, partial [Linum tenue]